MTNIEKDDLIKTPSFIKRINEPCPKCRALMYKVNDKIYCGQCALDSANRLKESQIRSHCESNPNALENYYKEKLAAKPKSRFRDNRSKQYKDN